MGRDILDKFDATEIRKRTDTRTSFIQCISIKIHARSRDSELEQFLQQEAGATTEIKCLAEIADHFFGLGDDVTAHFLAKIDMIRRAVARAFFPKSSRL